jgi:sulfur carrier protein
LAFVTDAGFALIQVTLNGKPRELASGMTLLALARALHLIPETVICEHNGQLCRVDAFADIVVQNGDTIEWLHFMGGGDLSTYTRSKMKPSFQIALVTYEEYAPATI